MTITIPSGRTLPLQAKAGGGFQSNGLTVVYDAPYVASLIAGGTTIRIYENRDFPTDVAVSTNKTVETAPTSSGPWTQIATNATFPLETSAPPSGTDIYARLVVGGSATNSAKTKMPTTGQAVISASSISHNQAEIQLEQWNQNARIFLEESTDGGATYYLSSVCRKLFPVVMQDLVPGKTYTWRVKEEISAGVFDTPSNAVTVTMPQAPARPFADGATITLTGSNFGALANPLPSAEDDFNYSGVIAVGDEIPLNINADAGARWESSGPVANLKSPMVQGDTRTVGSNQLCGFAASRKAELATALLKSGGQSRETTSIYVSWFLMLNEPLLSSEGNSQGADKRLRIWDDELGTRVSWLPYRVTYSGESKTLKGGFVANTSHKFHRCEALIDGNKFQLLVDGVSVVEETAQEPENFFTDFVKSAEYSSQPFFTERLGWDSSTPENYNDSFRVFLQGFAEYPNQARVEISERSTWTDVHPNFHKRYLQETISRSDTEIQFKIFQGNLDPRKTYYVYVIKPNGEVNQSGYPLTSSSIDVGTWSSS